MRPVPRTMSLRAKFMLLVFGVALVPQALLGFWLNRSSQRSGELLLAIQLDSVLTQVASEIGQRWVPERSRLLSVVEDAKVRRGLSAGRDAFGHDVPLAIRGAPGGDFGRAVQGGLVRDLENRPRWLVVIPEDTTPVRLVSISDTAPIIPERLNALTVPLPVYASPTSPQQIGTLEVWLRISALLPVGVAGVAGSGAVVAVLDRGASLVPLPFDVTLLEQSRFTWAGEEWLTARRTVTDPAVTLVAAAPLGPFTTPFARTARTGLGALLATTLVAFLMTQVLSKRLTRSLERLVTAADGVSAGDLEQRIDPGGGDEVGRVAQSFNAMTESLRRTLGRLAEREAVAAVGEFAATLAHEVRNPLSAMRLTLQSVEERVSHDPHLLAAMQQALRDIQRLEATVAGALQVARSGRVSLGTIDVREPIELAMRAAMPEFARRGAVLDPLESAAGATLVRGDGAALERLFLNLLMNAAQALGAGQHAGARIESEDGRVIVRVWDRGQGISSTERGRVLEPFYTTKPEGTGLGLAIVRQIVAAHSGELQIESEVGQGTTIRVSLLPAT